MNTQDRQPAITRICRGRAARGRADEDDYLNEEGIRPLEEKALGIQLLREACRCWKSSPPGAGPATKYRVE